VFVDLESVYPDYRNPAHEVSFEELRAVKRGWMSKNWRTQKEPLQQISGNSGSEFQAQPKAPGPDENLPEQFDEKLAIDEQSQPQAQNGAYEGKSGKARKFKVHGDSQTQTGNYLLFIHISRRLMLTIS
jgi:checkpoint serine/threonine-protein kinase